MAGIFAHVEDDITKLRKLKAEINDVKKSLLGINVKVDIDIKAGLEARLKSLTSEYDALAHKVAETEAKIANSIANINKATEKIVNAQNEVINNAVGGEPAISSPASSSAETSNIQAQAKSYSELEAEITKILGTREQNISKITEEQHSIDILKKQIKALNDDWVKTGQISDSDRALLDKYNAELLEHKTTLSGVQQVMKNEEKLNQAATGSMQQLALELARMRIAYRALTEEQKESPFGQDLQASIEQADAKIKGLDASIGNYQRNVGNYASQWNGLNFSIQQLAREMPSLAYGPQIFFSAISNNLPIFADELKRAKEEYNALKAAGQSATPVWKQILTSLVSWQTALTVGITLLTVYGKEIWEWVKSLFSGGEAAKLAAEQTKLFNEVLAETAKNSAKELIEIQKLNKMAQDHTKSLQERLSAINSLKAQFPSYYKNISDEAIMAGKASGVYKTLSANIIAYAKSQAYAAKYQQYFQKDLEFRMQHERQETMFRGRENDIEEYKKLRAGYDEYIRKARVSSMSGIDQVTIEDRFNYTKFKEFVKNNKVFVKELEAYWKDVENEGVLENMALMRQAERMMNKNLVQTGDYKNDEIEDTKTLLQLTKDIVAKEKELADIRAKANKGEARVTDVKKKEQELSNLKQEYQTRTGNTYGKINTTTVSEIKSENKLNKVREENKRLRLKSEQETANELEQLQIDLEQDATKKKIRQINLDYKLELQAIKNWEEEIKQAKIESVRREFEADQKNKDKVFDSSTVDTTLSTDESALLRQKEQSNLITYLNEINNIHRESYEKNKQIREEYIRNYGSYLEQLKLLQQQHSQRLLSLSTPEEIKLENANYEKSLEELKYKFGLVANSMADLFEDPSKKSVTAIQKIIDKYQGLLDILTAKKGQPITAETLSGLGLSQKQIDDVVSGKINVNDLADAVQRLNNELKNRSPFKSFSSDLTQAINDIKRANGDLGKIGQGISNIGNAVTAFTPALSSFSSSIANIFGYDDSDIQDVIGAVGGLGQTATGIGQMLSGDIVGGLMGAVGGISSVFSSFRSLADRDNEKRIKRLQEQIDVLQDSYDDLGKSIENAYSHDAEGLIEDQNKLLEQQKVLIKQQIKEEEDKKKTDKERIKEWEEQIKEIDEILEENKQKAIDAIFGEDLKSAIDRFATAYADAVASGNDKWKSARDYVKETVKNMVTESVKGALSSSKAIEKIRSKLKEFMTDNYLSSDEESVINRMAEQAMKELESEYGWADKYFKDSEADQEASSKGLASLSQETGEELNGRFTALQLAGESIKEHNIAQSETLSLINMTATDIKNMTARMENSLSGVADQISRCYIELQDINSNTADSAKVLKIIQSDIAEVKRNTANLN